MPSLFGKKKSSSSSSTPSTSAANRHTPTYTATTPTHDTPSHTPSSHPKNPATPPPPQQNSSSKKSKGYFVREREHKRPSSPRSSKSWTGSARSSRRPSEPPEHPLNLRPEERELHRLSALSVMSSPVEENGEPPAAPAPAAADDRMETTPAPDEPASSPVTNGEQNGSSTPPAPPLHRTPTTPSEQPEVPQVDAEACKAAGNKLYKAGQYSKAIEEYTKAIEASPATSTYLSNRAAAYMAANRYAEALGDCKSADELDPNNPKILHRLAKVYTALGRPQEALDVYDRIDPPVTAKDKAAALNMSTHILQAQDMLQSSSSGSMVLYAIEQAEKGLGVGVPSPRKWKLMRGEAYLRQSTVNSLGDAQNVAMSLLRANNADPEALVLRGRALYGQGENEKAIQHFRQALSCDPDFKDAVKYLRMVQKVDRMKEEGNTHFKSGRYQQAVDVYTTALEIDPLNKGTNSKILNNRAMCYSKLKQWQLAIQDCDKAVQLDPAYTKAKKTRAKALGEGGDWEEAVRAYKNIQEQSPEEPGIGKDIRNAELELKKSKRKDYYKILEVEKDATDFDIKRAYKKLAVKHHPDKNRDDPDAENRFKDLQEAHETLSDPQKRERYDSGADLMDPMDAFGGGGFGGFGGGGMEIDPEIIMNMMGGGGRGGGFSFGGSPFGGGMPGGGQRGFPGGGGFPFG